MSKELLKMVDLSIVFLYVYQAGYLKEILISPGVVQFAVLFFHMKFLGSQLKKTALLRPRLHGHGIQVRNLPGWWLSHHPL
jgi:hypothetical protein